MFPTAKSIPAEPAIDGDLVYFGSWSGSIYAFHKKTGEVVWKANGTALDSGTLIAFDGKVYLPHHSNIFKTLDGKTGDILNDGNTNDEEKGAFSDFNATPAFHARLPVAHSSRHAAASGCTASLSSPRSIASIPRPPRSTGPIQMAGVCPLRPLPVAASILDQAIRPSSTVSTKRPANHYGSTSSATASKKRRFASTATRSSCLPLMGTSMRSSSVGTALVGQRVSKGGDRASLAAVGLISCT